MTREPGRTCLGCRRVLPRRALVRLVRGANGVVVVDPLGTTAGRGAWVCADEACLARAVERRRLSHAFGKPCEAHGDIFEAVRAAGRRGAGAPPSEASVEETGRAVEIVRGR
ncbi:MAG TPA: YlxR family protein [Methylomirabilota bacterium]|nr:YlxR family protein [Methylomirabilota bacterium]